MVRSQIRRSTFREIKSSMGRFLSIMAIIGLGVGFFAGLKIARQAMVATVENYLSDHQFYDYRLLSTLGFDQESVDLLLNREDAAAAEGALSFDALYVLDGPQAETTRRQGVLKFHSLTEQINTVKLTEGRMPEAPGECVVDNNVFTPDDLGSRLVIAKENDGETAAHFACGEYTVVGLVQSPLYLQYERGNTSLGSGRLDGFAYLPREGFAEDYFTEIYVRFAREYGLYSDEYEAYLDETEDSWEEAGRQAADLRYGKLLSEAREELADAREEFERQKAEGEAALADMEAAYGEGLQEYREARREFEEKLSEAEAELADARKEIDEMGPPDTYLLGREANVGYVCFENDSAIVEGIANIFPVFFVLVAALVCVTTMNRMVEEQRTQIGVLKAIGYGEGQIMSKYMTYSGLAAVIGCVAGFFLGTWGFPKVIWAAYGIMYKAEPLRYVFDWKLALVSLAVSLLCSLGSTWLSCRVELASQAAQLMRPKAPRAGKRVLLERIPFLWNRLGFLRKVSLRNIFRYKKRLFMMILGISGCTALLVTGFGVRDSIADIAAKQFGEIQVFDLAAAFQEPAGEADRERLEKLRDQGIESYLCVMEKNMDLVAEKGITSVYLIVGDARELPGFVDLHTHRGEKIPYPGTGGCVVTDKLAEEYGLKAGEGITLRDEGMRTLTFTVTAVSENYLYDYVYISEEAWAEQMGEAPDRKTAYVNVREGADIHEAAAALMQTDNVANVTVNRDTMERVGSMMESLDIIVAVVILSAAGLAFIVLFNLTNINITERVREIATIKVLGFYKKETESYVFRENLILSVMGMVPGLALGKLLHGYVMGEIRIDMISFDVCVRPVSYLYSALLTIGFAWFVGKAMGGRLENISMTESLKSVD